MEKNKKHLLVVGGPTAVGKTAFSIDLARYFKTEIISADSRQLYKQLDIGTAKPTKEELAAVPHHFIDCLPLGEEYNAGQFERDALALLDRLFRKHEVVIVAGGSGMYVQALCQGIDKMPSIPEEVRRELNMQLKEKGMDMLLEELKVRDPAYFQQVDRQNPQRVIRALEVSRYTGRPFSDFRRQQFQERPFRIIKIGLERPREELYARIEQRMDQMIEEGLFEEAAKLYAYRHLNALQTVGYKEIFGYMEGEYGRDEAIRLLKRNSRHYAKRQLTWFKKDPEFSWFHPGQLNDALLYFQEKMKKKI